MSQLSHFLVSLWDELSSRKPPKKLSRHTQGPPAKSRCPCCKVTSAWSNCDFSLDGQWGVRTLQRVRTLATVHSPHHYSDCSLNLAVTTSGQIVTGLPEPWLVRCMGWATRAGMPGWNIKLNLLDTSSHAYPQTVDRPALFWLESYWELASVKLPSEWCHRRTLNPCCVN